MNVLLVVLEDFPGGDSRVRRQVSALTARGHSVTVLCASAYSNDVLWAGSEVVRTKVHRIKAGSFKRRFWEYLAFFAEMLVRVPVLVRQKRVDVIQVANMPDFLTVAALPAKLIWGVPVVLDMHDLMPELFGSKASSGGNILSRLMRLQERAGIRCADLVMTVNGICAKILSARNPGVGVEVIPNCPDSSTFRHRGYLPWQQGEAVKIGYHGTVARRFGVETLIRAYVDARSKGLIAELHVWGGGDGLERAKELAKSSGYDDSIKFYGQTPIDRMVDGLQQLHMSIVPYEADPYMEIAYSTKAFELAAIGIPMILAKLAGTTEQFSAKAAYFFSPGSVESLSASIRELAARPSTAEIMVLEARKEIDVYDWTAYGERYVNLLAGVR